jgi:MFS family permease
VAAADVQGVSPLPSRKYSAYALGLLAFINVLNFLDRNVIFALFEPIKRDLLLTDTQLGWLASAYILVFSIAALPLGVLSDLRSRRAVIAGGVGVWSAFTLLSGMVRGFWGLFTCRAVVGVGEAAYGPASQSLVADFYPGRGRAMAMAVLASGSALGGVLGIWLGGQLEAIYGWRVAFMAVGAPGFLLAFLVSRLRDPARIVAPIRLRKSLRRLEIGLSTVIRQFLPLLTMSGIGLVVAFWLAQARQTEAGIDIAVLGAFVGLGLAVNILRWVRRIRADQIDDTPFGGGVGDALDDMLGAVRFVLRTPTLVYVFLGGALFSFGVNGLVGWAPTFLSRELALSPAAAAVLLGKWGLVAGTAGTLFGGFLADWLLRYTPRGRILTAASGVILGAIFALWLLRIRDLDLFAPVFAISFFCMTWFNGPTNAVIFDVVPMRIGATVVGAYLLFIHLVGDAISFPLIGFLSDRFGLDFAVLFLPAVAIVGGIVVMLGARTVVKDMDRASTRVTGTFRKLKSAP